MKLDVFQERRRQQGLDTREPGAPERRGGPPEPSESDEPKSWTEKLGAFVERLNQPIGGAKDANGKGKAGGKGRVGDKPAGEARKQSWAEEMGLTVPPKPADAKARQEADEHIAQGTYHLKRGNRTKDVQTKLQCFEEALGHFKALKELVPSDPSVAKQVEKVERGVSELRSAFEKYRESNPGGRTKL